MLPAPAGVWSTNSKDGSIARRSRPSPRVVRASEGGADAGHLDDWLSFSGEESLVQKLERAREVPGSKNAKTFKRPASS